MKPATKEDIKYCGVSEEKIRNAKPKLDDEAVKYHHDWIFERYKIKKRKENGESILTTDDVLLHYRFCNVFREDDRQSRYLIDNITNNKSMSFENRFYNTLLFRMYNKWETLQKIGAPFDWASVDSKKVFETILLETKKDPKYVWFTAAFNTGGLKRASGTETILTKLKENHPDLDGIDYDEVPLFMMLQNSKYYADTFAAPKRDCLNYIEANPEYRIITRTDQNIPLRIVKLVQKLRKEKLHEKVSLCVDQKQCYETLKTVNGFGPFLAYQIFVDLTYLPEFHFSDKEFTVSGPGCSLGLSYLFKDMDGMTDEEAIFWVRDNIINEWKRLGLDTDVAGLFSDRQSWDRGLNSMQLENSFCEFSKYYKAKKGLGRPRNTYKPFVEESTALDNFT